MNVIPLVHSDVFHKKSVGADKTENLLEEIQKNYTIENAVANSNPGCWRSNFQFDNLDWLLNEVTDLVDKAVEHYKKTDSLFASIDIRKPYKIHYWTNVNEPGSRNTLHSHIPSSFSAIYYIQASNTGDLRLINPANILGNCYAKSPFTRDFYISPEDCDLFLWPAWIPHEVETNTSNKQRINIVFDITL